jgi:hypothetical protein
VWSDVEEEIIGGDLTAALAYPTPAGGVVLTPVAPVGLRDREAGTVCFTTSLGFGRKLDRIDENPRVALAYHAREHGFANDPCFVLVQGTARYDVNPDPHVLEETVRPASERFVGPPRTGPFWGRWLSAYYRDRVLVTVRVERVVSWPDLGCTGRPTVHGSPLPSTPAGAQAPPRWGTGPRVDVARAARRLNRLPHVLIGHLGADGLPVVATARVGARSSSGIALTGPFALSPSRAGLLGHRYGPRLIGLESRQYTGWLDDSVYAPHTESGFRAPANKTLLLLANGFTARRGLKRALAAGRGVGRREQRP